MAEKDREEVPLDRTQVKKAVRALQAFLRAQPSGEALFPEEAQPVSLLFTLWRIPRAAQTIRIPLPHAHRPDTDEVCLFTRDEPQMSPEQTQRFYRKLLEERGVTAAVSEIIPFKALKTEYKPYEAKRRLLGNFDVFLSDERIRRLLPSHLGKHFYQTKKTPLCVDLQSRHLARDVQRLVQGTRLSVSNRGCCCMARVGHSAMTADELTENIEAAVQTAAAKLRLKGPALKLIHLKSQTSVALPIYASDLSHLSAPDSAHAQGAASKKKAKKKKSEGGKKKETKEDEEEDEEIPQLVPIATGSKKPKLETPTSSRRKPLQKTTRAAGRRRSRAPGGKTGGAAPKGRRTLLRGK